MQRSIFALTAGAAFAALAAQNDAGAKADASILEHDTWLWSKAAPAGRCFGAGEAHPGKGWSDEPPEPAEIPTETTSDSVETALAEQAAKFDTAYGDLQAERDLLAEENMALKAKVDEQAEAIAKFYPDGDGKPGGSAPKSK